jgi:hypothetical protein
MLLLLLGPVRMRGLPHLARLLWRLLLLTGRTSCTWCCIVPDSWILPTMDRVRARCCCCCTADLATLARRRLHGTSCNDTQGSCLLLLRLLL